MARTAQVSETKLLMRALRDFNIPKIPLEDMVVFMGLISGTPLTRMVSRWCPQRMNPSLALADLFPGIEVPPKRNEELEGLTILTLLLALSIRYFCDLPEP